MSNFGDATFVDVSTGNATSTPLAIAGTYTGTAEENEYPGVLVNVETDVGGTLYIGFSVDGTNWKEEELDIDHAVYSYEFSRVKTGPHFRVRYINGSVGQSFFILSSYYGDYRREIPIERSERNNEGVAVYVQDQTTGVLDLPFLSELNTTTLVSDTVVGNMSVSLTTGHGAVTGNILEIGSSTNGSHFMQAKVLSVAGANTVNIDTPVSRIFTVADADVAISSDIMNVDGSVTPVVFSVAPTPVQVGDIVRIIFAITDSSDMDFEKFGAQSALTNGCVLRVNNGNGSYRNLYNFKSNGAIELYSYDARYAINNGGGVRAFTARATWGGTSKHGVVIRLDGRLGESLEMIIQDDLTGLDSFNNLVQGSEVQ